MIRGVVLLLILGLCAPAGAAARARKVVVILPPAAAGDGADLALVMQTRAAALLARTRGVQDGAAALARLAAGAQVDAGRPATTSDAAVAAYARCYARIVAQPL